MKKIICSLFVLLLSACGGGGGDSAGTSPQSSQIAQYSAPQPIEMLWNPGPSYAANIEQGPNFGACDEPALVDMSEAMMVGNGILATQLTCGSDTVINPGNTAPSYFINTLWEPEYYGTSPGYNAQKLSGGAGVPIVTKLTNDAALDPTPCNLREVSVSYIPWRDLQQFKGFQNLQSDQNNTVFRDQYDILKFQSITATVSAKLDYTSGHSACASFPKNVVEYDAAVQYFDASGNLLRTDIGGISLYDEGQLHNPGTTFIYNSTCPAATAANPPVCQVAVAGSMIGYPELTSAWQNYSFDLVSLFKTYFPAPPAGTAKSILIDAEAYSSVQNASNIVEVTNMDLKGILLQ